MVPRGGTEVELTKPDVRREVVGAELVSAERVVTELVVTELRVAVDGVTFSDELRVASGEAGQVEAGDLVGLAGLVGDGRCELAGQVTRLSADAGARSGARAAAGTSAHSGADALCGALAVAGAGAGPLISLPLVLVQDSVSIMACSALCLPSSTPY